LEVNVEKYIHSYNDINIQTTYLWLKPVLKVKNFNPSITAVTNYLNLSIIYYYVILSNWISE